MRASWLTPAGGVPRRMMSSIEIIPSTSPVSLTTGTRRTLNIIMVPRTACTSLPVDTCGDGGSLLHRGSPARVRGRALGITRTGAAQSCSRRSGLSRACDLRRRNRHCSSCWIFPRAWTVSGAPGDEQFTRLAVFRHSMSIGIAAPRLLLQCSSIAQTKRRYPSAVIANPFGTRTRHKPALDRCRRATHSCRPHSRRHPCDFAEPNERHIGSHSRLLRKHDELPLHLATAIFDRQAAVERECSSSISEKFERHRPARAHPLGDPIRVDNKTVRDIL